MQCLSESSSAPCMAAEDSEVKRVPFLPAETTTFCANRRAPSPPRGHEPSAAVTVNDSDTHT